MPPGKSLRPTGRALPMATWQEKVVTRLGPPISLCGAVYADWRRVLRDNDFAVDSPYFFRAVSTTLASLANSCHAWFEEKVYGPRVAKVQIKPPIFILGHWRT